MLFSAAQIAAAVERLATEIALHHRRQPLVLLGVLKGSICFTPDLARALARKADGPSEIMVDYICVERYTQVTADASLPLEGTNLVLVDNIVDRGLTLAYLQALLAERRPAKLRTCVLFDKPAHREVEIPIDYRGLAVPDVFAIGYGLDYKESYRNLPYLAELREGQTV